MRPAVILLASFVAIALLGHAVQAQPVNSMLNECSRTAQDYFRDWEARTDMKYNGQRVDGTHAINGRIFLETRFEDFACSFGRNGARMVEFFAEGRLQNAFLPGGGGSNRPSGRPNRPSIVQVTGVPPNDVLNVRNEPSPRARIVGALGNGDSVRNLGCSTQGSSTWCQIEMMTDMRERGWVNARYLSRGAATQLPESAPPAPPAAGETRTVRVQFSGGSNGTEFRDTIAPGASVRYLLNARNGQSLYVRVVGNGLGYQILNPDGSFLLDQVPAAQEYRGQLWQSGDHVIEVINRNNQTRSYNVIFGID